MNSGLNDRSEILIAFLLITAVNFPWFQVDFHTGKIVLFWIISFYKKIILCVFLCWWRKLMYAMRDLRGCLTLVDVFEEIMRKWRCSLRFVGYAWCLLCIVILNKEIQETMFNGNSQWHDMDFSAYILTIIEGLVDEIKKATSRLSKKVKWHYITSH